MNSVDGSPEIMGGVIQMRMAKTLALATATMLAALPAIAQNTTESANAADVAATNAVDANASAATDLNATAVPETTTTETTTTETAPAPPPAEKSFPWGVLGLLGLLGLIPRMRRG
jgi:MYXO-CTERM domain-containing protein